MNKKEKAFWRERGKKPVEFARQLDELKAKEEYLKRKFNDYTTTTETDDEYY